MLNDEKFAFLRIEDKQLLGKSKSETKALVVAIGCSTAQAGSLNLAVARLGDYLEQQSY